MFGKRLKKILSFQSKYYSYISCLIDQETHAVNHRISDHNREDIIQLTSDSCPPQKILAQHYHRKVNDIKYIWQSCIEFSHLIWSVQMIMPDTYKCSYTEYKCQIIADSIQCLVFSDKYEQYNVSCRDDQEYYCTNPLQPRKPLHEALITEYKIPKKI